MINNYGNYVVQKALKLSSKNVKIMLINNIFKHIDKIKDKKLKSKWKSIIESNLEGTFEEVFDERFSFKSKNVPSLDTKLQNFHESEKGKNIEKRHIPKNTSIKYNNKGNFEKKAYNKTNKK